jgi:transporter family protein
LSVKRLSRFSRSDILLESMTHASSVEVGPRRTSQWFWLSLLTILLWGAWGLQSKLIVDQISPWTNQFLFPLGLLPLMLAMRISNRYAGDRHQRAGNSWAFLTGVLGGIGNIAFYVALLKGKVSIVVPLTGLFPIITVAAARIFLKERINRWQIMGLVLATMAIYLLSF